MRKFNVKKAIAGVSAAALIFTAGTVIPNYQNINFVNSVTASAASITLTDLEYSRGQHIYNYLKDHTSWNDGAICGILAHLYTESHFNPKAVNLNSGAYGIAQWLGVRKTNLQKIYNYSSVDVQLDFMIKELKDSYYSISKNAINNASNDANGAYKTAYEFRFNYGWGGTNLNNVTQKQQDDCTERANEAKNFFYSKFASKTTYLPGDVNLDKVVDLTDVTYLSQYLLGDRTLTAQAKKNADVNNDGSVSIVDLATLKNIITQPVSPKYNCPFIKKLSKGTGIYSSAGAARATSSVSVDGSYTIIAVSTVNGKDYGQLKSGAGWVIL